MTQDTMSKHDENEFRWGKLAETYELLSQKLKIQAEIDEKKDLELKKSMDLVSDRILQSASNLTKKQLVPEENPQKEDYYSNLKRRRTKKEEDKKQASEFDPLRYWIVSKKGL